MGAIYNKATSSVDFLTDSIYAMPLSMLIPQAAAGKKFVAFADRHDLKTSWEAVLSNDSLEAMAADGFKHICLELPKSMQQETNAYNNQEITFSALLKQYAVNYRRPALNADDNKSQGILLANMIKRAKELDINVHYVDSDEPLPIRLEKPDLYRVWNQIRTIQDPQQRQLEAKKLEQTNPSLAKQVREFAMEYRRQRLQRDASVAAEVKKMGETGKVALLFGKDHFAGDNDLNELLGKEDTVVISMEESLKRTLAEEIPADSADLPNYVYYTHFDFGNGKPAVGAVGRIQANNNRTHACKESVDYARGYYALLGCTVEDVALQEFAKNLTLPVLPKRIAIAGPS